MSTLGNPRKKRKHVDLTCIKKGSDWQKLGYPPGQYCTALDEYYPQLERAGCETVYGGNNNSEIVFGRDRNASLASGNGGSGGTQCGMIDLVAGRLSSHIRKPTMTRGDSCDVMTGPNFAADAARVYLTQRGDIDKYFQLPKGRTFGTTRNSSAVGIKADHTRIIGRDTVRIYAGKGQFDGYGRTGELNSRGGQMETKGVIELVAGGQHNNIQPAVLGENLSACLRGLYRLIAQAFSAIHASNQIQSWMYSYLGSHTHTVLGLGAGVAVPDPFLASMTINSFGKTLVIGFDQIMSQFNGVIEQMNYTGIGDPNGFGTIPGADDICSNSVYLT